MAKFVADVRSEGGKLTERYLSGSVQVDVGEYLLNDQIGFGTVYFAISRKQFIVTNLPVSVLVE
jgi:hypothetical protein